MRTFRPEITALTALIGVVVLQRLAELGWLELGPPEYQSFDAVILACAAFAIARLARAGV